MKDIDKKDCYDFGKIESKENYSPQLKKLIEKNRPEKVMNPKS